MIYSLPMHLDSFQTFLFDIEGTVVPISFVHEVLFPYSKRKLKEYLNENPLSEYLFSRLKNEYIQDNMNKIYTNELDFSAESITKYLSFLISIDRKSSVLKEVQGEIWRVGYESGEVQSNFFQDTVPFFESIKNKGKNIYIYSSGSILAQKLIFGYSTQGNLNPLISGYFDTGVGHKRNPDSYRKILESLAISPNEICFFTDIQEEAEAAFSIGISCFLMEREGNAKIEQPKFQLLKSFLF